MSTSPSASPSPSSPKCLRETGRGAVSREPPQPPRPSRRPRDPAHHRGRAAASWRSARQSARPRGRRGVRGDRVGPRRMRAARRGRGTPYQHAAAQDLHRQQQRQLPRGRAVRLQSTRQGQHIPGQPPLWSPPPWPRAAHPRDGVDGGLGLALPGPVLAQRCAEGRGDAGGEVQAELQPPDAQGHVPGGLCSDQREGSRPP